MRSGEVFPGLHPARMLNMKTTLALRTLGDVDKYPAKIHAQRVAAELKLTNGLILLKGETAATFSNSDQERPFRQDRYFYYLTGCAEPDCYVTYEVDKDKLTLWLPPATDDHVFYDGRPLTVETAMEVYDIDEAKYIEGKRKRRSNVSKLLKQHHEAGGQTVFLFGHLANVLNKDWRDAIRSSNPRPGQRLRKALNVCRIVKDANEVTLIRKANDITAEAHENVLKNLHRMKSEAEVEAVYMATCIAHGAKEQAYKPICASGTNASQLHYIDNDQTFTKQQVLLIDGGAECCCYASDVTRTMPLNRNAPGHWQSKEAEKVYAWVEKIQEACIAELAPGKKFMHVAWYSAHLAIDALLDMGILKGDHMDIFHSGTILAFYPYGLGHHVGLEVHDVEPAAAKTKKSKDGKQSEQTARLRNVAKAYRAFTKSYPQYAATIFPLSPTRLQTADLRLFSLNSTGYHSPSLPSAPPLKAGNIVTVEPGIYFNAYVIEKYFLPDEKHSKFVDKDVLARYMHVGGVRIEDDVLITKTGYEVLTTTAKGEKALELIREGAKSAASASA